MRGYLGYDGTRGYPRYGGTRGYPGYELDVVNCFISRFVFYHSSSISFYLFYYLSRCIGHKSWELINDDSGSVHMKEILQVLEVLYYLWGWFAATTTHDITTTFPATLTSLSPLF